MSGIGSINTGQWDSDSSDDESGVRAAARAVFNDVRQPPPSQQVGPSFSVPPADFFRNLPCAAATIRPVPQSKLPELLSDFTGRCNAYFLPVQGPRPPLTIRESDALTLAARPENFAGQPYAHFVGNLPVAFMSVSAPTHVGMPVNALVTGPFVSDAGANLIAEAATISQLGGGGGRLDLIPLSMSAAEFYLHLGFNGTTGSSLALDPASHPDLWAFNGGRWMWRGGDPQQTGAMTSYS